MGWRSTGGAFRAGNYNGPLTSDEGGFASGFAKTFTAGISRASDIIAGEMQAQRDQKREEDLIRLRETLAAQRDAATASRNTEKKNAETLAATRALADSLGMGGDPSFMAYAASAIQAADGDVSQARKAIQDDVTSGLVVLNPSSSADPGPSVATAPPAEVPQAPVPALTPDPASMDDLEATEISPQPAAFNPANTGISAEPAVFRPEQDAADVTLAQATVEEPTAPAEDTLGVPTPPAAAPRFRLDFDAPLRTEVAAMSSEDLIANIRVELDAGSPNTRRLELMQSALGAKREEQFMTLTDDQLMSYAASSDQGARTLASRVLESRLDIREQIAEDPENILKGLETTSQTAGRRLEVANDPDIPQGQKDAILKILDGHMESLFEIDSRKRNTEAAADRPFDLYAPLNADGMVAGGGGSLLRLRMNEDGQLVDQAGRPAEGNWMPLLGDDIEGQVKFNNSRIDEIVQPMASTANVVRDLVDLRDIIIETPAVTNRFATTAEGLRSIVNQGLTLISSLTEPDREYTLVEMEELIAGQNIGRAQQEMAILQLRAAYGLAAIEGSSGQALSDNELKKNLDSLIQQGDPRNSINSINRNIQRAMERSETDRSTRAGAMVTFGAGGAAMFSDAIWQTPMSDFVPQQIGEGRMASYQAAMAGEIPEMSVRTTELPIPQDNAANKPTVQRPNQQAIDMLKSNPSDEMVQFFEEIFGQGSAAQYIDGGN